VLHLNTSHVLGGALMFLMIFICRLLIKKKYNSAKKQKEAIERPKKETRKRKEELQHLLQILQLFIN
jgi:phosphate/sulfate permease